MWQCDLGLQEPVELGLWADMAASLDHGCGCQNFQNYGGRGGEAAHSVFKKIPFVLMKLLGSYWDSWWAPNNFRLETVHWKDKAMLRSLGLMIWHLSFGKGEGLETGIVLTQYLHRNLLTKRFSLWVDGKIHILGRRLTSSHGIGHLFVFTG